MASRDRKSVRVVVADDTPQSLFVIEMFLGTMRGIEITAAVRDGLQAVEKVVESSPDFVLLDRQMPNLGGLEAAARIKTLPFPPVVFLMSVFPDPDIEERLRANDIDGFILKDKLVDLLPAELDRFFPNLGFEIS